MASAMRIRLKGRELAFPAKREIILGRDPMVDVRSDNPLVSRHHARLRPQQLGWVLEDTKSKHGTFVDGKPITSLAVTGPMTVWLAEPNAGEVVLLLPEGTPSGIFISYRREGASGESGRLYDHLIAHFGEQMVFRDIDTITPGSDFVSRIEDAFGACQVVLVIIWRSWLTITGPVGQRSLAIPTTVVVGSVAAPYSCRWSARSSPADRRAAHRHGPHRHHCQVRIAVMNELTLSNRWRTMGSAQNSMTPCAVPKFTLVPGASVTLRPGTTSSKPPVGVAAVQVVELRFRSPHTSGFVGCWATSATGRSNPHFSAPT